MAFYGDTKAERQAFSPVMEHMKRNTVAYRLCQRSEGLSYFLASVFTNLMIRAGYQSGNIGRIKIADVEVNSQGVITARLEGV